MNLKLAFAKLSKISYIPGDDFTLSLRFESQEGLNGLSNLSINLFRAEQSRNQFEFGFGTRPRIDENTLIVTQKLPSTLRPGIYTINGATLFQEDLQQQQPITFEPIIFAIQSLLEVPLTQEALSKRVTDLSQERQRYAQREIVTTIAVGSSSRYAYRVLIFGVGCLLHVQQQLEGFVITPLQGGFSSARMQEIVGNTLEQTGLLSLNYDSEVESQFQRATPTFLIDYWRVLGISHEDALNHCRRHADLMFDLLGLDRGQKPREFYCLAIDQVTGESRHLYSLPWYRGNLISDFNPVSTANMIETVTPRLEADPFLRLLVRSYAEATREDDPGIAFLRSWTVLELLADRAITKGQPIKYSNGSPILNQKGNPKDTNGKEARVYELIRQYGSVGGHFSSNINGTERQLLLEADELHPAYTPETRLITLWDVIRSAYAIRNCVAHEGYFSIDHIDPVDVDQVLAADLIRSTPFDPREWIHDQVKLAVRRELHKT